MARPKKVKEEVVELKAELKVPKIVPLDHADWNTAKAKINEIVDYINAL